MNTAVNDNVSLTEWLRNRKDAATRISPIVAEVTIVWDQVHDPYNIDSMADDEEAA